MRATIVMVSAIILAPLAAGAQGTTQSRDGLATASQGKGVTNNSGPAGSVNATTGPQSRPAYPSGSDTPNPGSAFVATQPKPATGAQAKPSGVLSTTKMGPGGAQTQSASPGVGQAAAPPK